MIGGWGPLDGFRIGAGHLKDQDIIRGWNFQFTPQSLGKEKGSEIDLITNSQ